MGVGASQPDKHVDPVAIDSRRTIRRKIGRGEYGRTVEEQQGPNVVVTKYFTNPKDMIAENTGEIATLRYLKGLPSVAQIINTSNKNSRARCTSLSYPCVVMKAEQSSLYSWIESYNSKPLPWETVFTLCIDILQGYNVLHSANITHRDTKPENILITTSTNAVISDFGSSVFTLPTIPYIQDEYTGTIWYSPPEVILHNILKYDFKVRRTDYSYIDGFAQDAWGVGLVLFELVTKSEIFFSTPDTNANQLYTIVKAKGPITSRDGNTFVLYTDYLQHLNDTDRTKLNTIPIPTQSIEQILEAAIPVNSSCRRLIPIITGLLDYNPMRRFTIQQALTSVVMSPPITIYKLPPMFEYGMIRILQEPQNLSTSYSAIDTCLRTIRTIVNIDDTYHILFDRACLFFLQLVQIKKLDPTKLEIYYNTMILLAYALFDNKRYEIKNDRGDISNFNFLISQLPVTDSPKSHMNLIKDILLVDIQFFGKTILDKMLASMRPLTPEKIKRAHEINKHCFVTNTYTTLLQSIKPDELVTGLCKFANSDESVSSLHSAFRSPHRKQQTPKRLRKSVTRRKRAGV